MGRGSTARASRSAGCKRRQVCSFEPGLPGPGFRKLLQHGAPGAAMLLLPAGLSATAPPHLRPHRGRACASFVQPGVLHPRPGRVHELCPLCPPQPPRRSPDGHLSGPPLAEGWWHLAPPTLCLCSGPCGRTPPRPGPGPGPAPPPPRPARPGRRGGRTLTAMTLTKVVLPEYCSPTSVSSISSFQKSERNQSSRREMSASMMAAGTAGGRAAASPRAGLGPDPPTAPPGPGATRADAGGRRRPEPGSPAGHMTRPPPRSSPRRRRSHGKSGEARPARRVRRLQRHLLGPPGGTARRPPAPRRLLYRALLRSEVLVNPSLILSAVVYGQRMFMTWGSAQKSLSYIFASSQRWEATSVSISRELIK